MRVSYHEFSIVTTSLRLGSDDRGRRPRSGVRRGGGEGGGAPTGAGGPDPGAGWGPGAGGDRVLDRPHHDRARRLLSVRGSKRGGAAAVLRELLLGRRGGRDVLLDPRRRDVAPLGRADARRLRPRRQGARADDRAADRDEAAAQGGAGGAARGGAG